MFTLNPRPSTVPAPSEGKMNEGTSHQTRAPGRECPQRCREVNPKPLAPQAPEGSDGQSAFQERKGAGRRAERSPGSQHESG